MSDESTVRLSVVADASQPEQAFAKVQSSATRMAQGVAQAGKQAADGLRQVGDGLKGVGEGLKGTGEGLGQATEKLTKEQSRLLESIRKQTVLATEGKAAYLEQRAAMAGVSAQASDFISKLRQTEQGQQQVGMSARATAAALRQVPAQFTDIATSLAAGQRPMQVLLQQGGQLKDLFGGIGPAAQALGGYVIGLVNPFTLAAGAVAGLGIAMGSTESSLRQSNSLVAQLQATGRGADFTGEQLKALRIELEHLPGVSKEFASATIAEFARTRQIGGTLFRELGTIVADFAAATGTQVPDAAKALAKAFADPVQGAKQLEEELGFLTAAQLLAIQRMGEIGDKAGAQKLLFDALKSSVQGLANEAMTPLQRATNDLGNAWGDSMRALEQSGPLRAANGLLADMIGQVTYLVRALPELRLPGQGGVGGRISGMGMGLLAFGPLGMSLGAAVGGREPNAGQSRGATGTWEDPTKALDDQVKAMLAATTSYKSAAGAIEEMRGKAAALTATLNGLKAAGKGNSDEAREIAERLRGVNEKIAEASKKSGAAATSQYNDLTQRIRERIRLADEELRAGRPLSEAEREQAKILEMLGGAKGKLNEQQRAAVLGDLEEAKSKELLLQVQRAELAQAGEVARARQALRNLDYAQSDAALADIDRSNGERLRSISDRMKALQDEGQAAALAAVRNISLAQAIEEVAIARLEEQRARTLEGSQEYDRLTRELAVRRQLVQEIGRKEARSAAEDQLKDQIKLLERSDDIAADVFARIASEGSDAFEAIGKSIKANLINEIYKLTVRPFVIQFVGAISGASPEAIRKATGSYSTPIGTAGRFPQPSDFVETFAGSRYGQALGLSNAAPITGNNPSAYVPAGAELTELGRSVSSFANTAGNAIGYINAAMAAKEGRWGEAVGSAVGTYFGGPVGSMIGSELGKFVDEAVAGETRFGAMYKNAEKQQGPSGGEISGAREVLQGTIDAINNSLKAYGSSLTLKELYSGLESSDKGKGFVFGGGQLSNGAEFGEDLITGYQNRRGDKSQEQALKEFSEELKQASLQALLAADVPGILGDYLKSLGDIDALTGGALDKAVDRVGKALTERASLQEQLFALTHTEEEIRKKALDDQRAALDESNRALFDQVTALQQQKEALSAATSAFQQQQNALYLASIEASNKRAQLAADEEAYVQEQLRATIDANRAYAKSLRDTRDAILGLDTSLAGLNTSTNVAKSAFEEALEAVTPKKWRFGFTVGGGLSQGRVDALQDSSVAYLEALKQSARSSEEYALEVARLSSILTLTASRADSNASIAARTLRGYANGGLASGLAIVGERGPELVDFRSPARVYTSNETAELVARIQSPPASGAPPGTAGLERLISDLKVALEAVALHCSDSAGALRQMRDRGVQVEPNRAGVPLEMRVVE